MPKDKKEKVDEDAGFVATGNFADDWEQAAKFEGVRPPAPIFRLLGQV